ncbi:MAG: hypothetical protein CME06_12925 [Gemmatimonadetes bacterium]|nr:hypothetical protein [Gemmatimonadota bacterium]
MSEPIPTPGTGSHAAPQRLRVVVVPVSRSAGASSSPSPRYRLRQSILLENQSRHDGAALDAFAYGRAHLAGLAILGPHLSRENH